MIDSLSKVSGKEILILISFSLLIVVEEGILIEILYSISLLSRLVVKVGISLRLV